MQLKKYHEKCFQSSFFSLIGITAFCFTFFLLLCTKPVKKYHFTGFVWSPCTVGWNWLNLPPNCLVRCWSPHALTSHSDRCRWDADSSGWWAAEFGPCGHYSAECSSWCGSGPCVDVRLPCKGPQRLQINFRQSQQATKDRHGNRWLEWDSWFVNTYLKMRQYMTSITMPGIQKLTELEMSA